jgi:hypothetical protein
MYQPVKIAQINDLQLGARDFVLVLDKGLLFVAMSEMNISTRLDSYITNVSVQSSFLKECLYIVHYALGYQTHSF